MNPYRHPCTPEIAIVGVEADPFPAKKGRGARVQARMVARTNELLAIERAAHRLVRATETADAAREGFPDSRELNEKCSKKVIDAFDALARLLEPR